MAPQKKKQKVEKRKGKSEKEIDGKKMFQSGASWDLSDSEDEKAVKYSCFYELIILMKKNMHTRQTQSISGVGGIRGVLELGNIEIQRVKVISNLIQKGTVIGKMIRL